MTRTSVTQHSLSPEQPLQFIRTHQDAFDVEPIFPLKLFEEFVVGVKSNLTIEASCKVEVDKLLASRFLLFFQNPVQQWQECLSKTINFFNQVENQVGVNLNYDLLRNFIGNDFDYSKMTELTAGIDLRTNICESSLKMHIGINDYQKEIKKVLAADKGNLADIDPFLLQKAFLIGFDYYLDGRTEVEIYAALNEAELKSYYIQNYLRNRFSSAVLQPLLVSDIFYIGLSKVNPHPILYYRLKHKKDLQNYFKLNDMAYKVNNFYQQQFTRQYMWVGVEQKELEKPRIDNIRLYYHKYFAI
ncbi:LynF/TruF/PatF family peptide O-prenyltransferase [Anabaena azotica]|uniref:LynF/TruF/PatF family peptide O-prenyltransferase n=1 Tax=Anabaena azotica FACHB-119 TaxID=947527 RepID=A0ABR8DCI0_9NOST|nr:DUF5838 family protein [Anabaena azotica]MBD2504678.1 LynF/TruF/PatF family peptide O-prenyltransferase [Anabaena azotica FACHB-119]